MTWIWRIRAALAKTPRSERVRIVCPDCGYEKAASAFPYKGKGPPQWFWHCFHCGSGGYAVRTLLTPAPPWRPLARLRRTRAGR
jgi:hypothetical protein